VSDTESDAELVTIIEIDHDFVLVLEVEVDLEIVPVTETDSASEKDSVIDRGLDRVIVGKGGVVTKVKLWDTSGVGDTVPLAVTS
jgi:hypothetical protein